MLLPWTLPAPHPPRLSVTFANAAATCRDDAPPSAIVSPGLSVPLLGFSFCSAVIPNKGSLHRPRSPRVNPVTSCSERHANSASRSVAASGANLDAPKIPPQKWVMICVLACPPGVVCFNHKNSITSCQFCPIVQLKPVLHVSDWRRGFAMNQKINQDYSLIPSHLRS